MPGRRRRIDVGRWLPSSRSAFDPRCEPSRFQERVSCVRVGPMLVARVCRVPGAGEW